PFSTTTQRDRREGQKGGTEGRERQKGGTEGRERQRDRREGQWEREEYFGDFGERPGEVDVAVEEDHVLGQPLPLGVPAHPVEGLPGHEPRRLHHRHLPEPFPPQRHNDKALSEQQ